MQLIIIFLIYVKIKSYETNTLRRTHEVLYSYNCAKKCEGKTFKSISIRETLNRLGLMWILFLNAF
jgi:hypothetical protein